MYGDCVQYKYNTIQYNGYQYYSAPGSAFILFSVLKMTSNSGANCPVDVLGKVFTSTKHLEISGVYTRGFQIYTCTRSSLQ